MCTPHVLYMSQFWNGSFGTVRLRKKLNVQGDPVLLFSDICVSDSTALIQSQFVMNTFLIWFKLLQTYTVSTQNLPLCKIQPLFSFSFPLFSFLVFHSLCVCVHTHTLLLSTPCDNVNINININVGDESEGEEEREHESEVKEQFLGKLIRQFLN